MERPSRRGLRAHLGEVIADAELREHALEVSAPPPGADRDAVAEIPPPSASLTGAVTPMSEARADVTPITGTTIPTPSAPILDHTPTLQVPTQHPSSPPHNPLAMSSGAADTEEALSQGGRRRRRSASPLPSLPIAADIPDDALGRVTFFTLSAAPDVAPAPVVPVDPPAASVPRHSGNGAALDEWIPVVLLGAALLVVFIVGVVVTH